MVLRLESATASLKQKEILPKTLYFPPAAEGLESMEEEKLEDPLK